MTVSTRAVWIAFGAVAAAMLVTYSRVPAHDLYHVSGGGLVDGGLSRVLVYANFPVALAAALLGGLAAGRAGARLPGAVCVALCAVVAVPGVVSQSNLDAKWVNAVPALGVALALALELRAGPGLVRVGRGTIAAVVALALLSLVWIAAEAGVHETFGVFLAGQPRPVEPAVHLGHHHGLDGAMLAAAGLVLLRAPRSEIGRAYVSLLFAYGLVNFVQDGWTEQVVKRGWTSHTIPNALEPRPNLAWLAILVIAGCANVLAATGAGGSRRRPTSRLRAAPR